jgi:hypothetical protein
MMLSRCRMAYSDITPTPDMAPSRLPSASLRGRVPSLGPKKDFAQSSQSTARPSAQKRQWPQLGIQLGMTLSPTA